MHKFYKASRDRPLLVYVVNEQGELEETDIVIPPRGVFVVGIPDKFFSLEGYERAVRSVLIDSPGEHYVMASDYDENPVATLLNGDTVDVTRLAALGLQDHDVNDAFESIVGRMPEDALTPRGQEILAALRKHPRYRSLL